VRAPASRNLSLGFTAVAIVLASGFGLYLKQRAGPPAASEAVAPAAPPEATTAVGDAAPRADPALAESAAQMVPPPFGTPLALQADPRRLRELMAAGEAAFAASADQDRQIGGAKRIQIAAALGFGPARRMIVQDYARARLLRAAVPAPDAVRYSLDGFTIVAPPPATRRPAKGVQRVQDVPVAPEAVQEFVTLAKYFASRQEHAAYATHLVEAIRDDARLQIDRRLAPLFDALAAVEGACAAVARNVAGARETPAADCGPALRQRVIARARSARAVGREFESRRQALWLLEQLDGPAQPPAEAESPRPSVRVLPGFPTMPAANKPEPGTTDAGR
jgi:hypothetical protein